MRQLKLLGLFLLLMSLLFVQSALAADEDTYDDTPDVTARVSRISFISGEVQIRRSGSDEWEKAALNLPLVEGDQIATGASARVELQLDSYNYVRLAENSFLTFNTLRDGQVAVSLPEGTVSVRVLAFDSQQNSFEIDAPKTTLAVQKAGMYRIDAGDKTSEVLHITVTDGGQARIYSDNSGFLLKNSRTATLYLSGDNVGEPEIDPVAKYTDEWDSWVLERDSIVAKKLKDSYYDKYYDRDMYGAEDLGDYGEWIYTRSYGYVWRPYRSAISSYDNWTPYRYGSWRWVPPYGWIWMADEPWGWSTYHFGRWVWYGGVWVWTPYAQHRWGRSWWQPAYVVITGWGNSICWYPLPYNYYYYNYNSYYYSNHHYGGYYGGNHNGGNHNGGNHNGGNHNPPGTPNPNGTPTTGGGGTPVNSDPVKGPKKPPFQPAGALDPAYIQAVSTTDSGSFGAVRGGVKQAPLSVATQAVTRPKDPVKLPVFTDIRNTGADVKPNQQVQVAVRNGKLDRGGDGTIKIGAAVREPGVKLDENLRKDRVLGGRPPLENPQVKTGGSSGSNNGADGSVRATGAVKRDDAPLVKNAGGQTPRDTGNSEPVRSSGGGKPNRDDSPSVKPRSDDSNDEPVRQAPPPKPRYEPPPQEKPRYEPPPPPQEKPRNDPPPPREEKPRYEPPPRYDPPPRNDPPPRSEPKSEPKSEPRPEKPSSPPSDNNKKSKDGK